MDFFLAHHNLNPHIWRRMKWSRRTIFFRMGHKNICGICNSKWRMPVHGSVLVRKLL